VAVRRWHRTRERPPAVAGALSPSTERAQVTDPSSGAVIRRALPAEADHLTALAVRSKAYWGYDEEFLEKVRPLLTFSTEDVAQAPMYVLTVAGEEPVGVYRITGTSPEGELADLWLGDTHASNPISETCFPIRNSVSLLACALLAVENGVQMVMAYRWCIVIPLLRLTPP